MKARAPQGWHFAAAKSIFATTANKTGKNNGFYWSVVSQLPTNA